MAVEITTLACRIRDDERAHPDATGVFSSLLEHIALAGKIISRETNQAGLADILGLTGDVNVQGEEVRKLDEFAHDTLVSTLSKCGHVAGLASEEEESVLSLSEDAKYLVLFDPLDGSSNIEANVSVGTIFSILRRDRTGPVTEEEFFQPGMVQVAAGYLVYGSSTMLVYTTGNGVHGFTLDPSLGEFLLSHPDIRIPSRGQIFSVNMGNAGRFEERLRAYLDHITSSANSSGRPYSLRYVGTLVSDFHRNLLYGGIFLYPADARHQNGKLRLLYEASPLALIVEQAGGKASTGHTDVLALTPTRLHERAPLFIGSRDDVEELNDFLMGRRPIKHVA